MCNLINCASKIIDPVRLWTINALFILNLNFVWRTLSHKLHNFPALASHLSRARTFLMVELPPVPPVCLCSPMDVKGPPQLVWLCVEWLAAAWSIDPFGKEQKHKDCSWGNDAVSVSTHRGEADMLLSRLTPIYYSLDMNTAALSPPKSAHVPPKHDGNTCSRAATDAFLWHCHWHEWLTWGCSLQQCNGLWRLSFPLTLHLI